MGNILEDAQKKDFAEARVAAQNCIQWKRKKQLQVNVECVERRWQS